MWSFVRIKWLTWNLIRSIMLRKKKIQKLFPFFVALGLCNIVLFASSELWNIKSSCDFYEFKAVIIDTCANYKAGLVGGSLCEALCEKKSISLSNCVNHKIGRSVLYMNYTLPDGTSETVVMKMQVYPDDEGLTPVDVNDNLLHSSDSIYVNTMKKQISVKLKRLLDDRYYKINETVLSSLWGYNVTSYLDQFHNKSNAIRSVLRSVWLLIQQREYVLMRLNQHVKSIPKIYGSCGAAYFMEYARSLGTIKTGLSEGRGVSIHLTDWKFRAPYALQILQFLPDLETKFGQTYHMCDVKDPNLGIRSDESITMIDLDHDVMDIELAAKLTEQSCVEDLNCGFLTCPGLCDEKLKKCKGERTNNNLQSICEIVFLRTVGGINSGLLRAPPKSIEKDLMRLLHQCAYPPNFISPIAHDRGVGNFLQGNTRRVIHKPGEDIRLKLIEVIKRGIRV